MAKRSDETKIVADGSLQRLPLSRLHLDHSNPRFGGQNLTAVDEKKIVDEIIGQHGIVDVISSIATNGYFDSEPLVGAINKGHNGDVTVVEGNRRLTAAFVLAGDIRAAGYEKLRAEFPNNALQGKVALPVLVYDWKKKQHRAELLPFLGVRHIIGATQWDSFAKAAWVATVIDEEGLKLEDIKRMIGDNESFTDRILEGYHLVRQLISTNTYDPAESLRKGRGSMQDFPFSWIYTALGYRTVRSFLGLPTKEYAIHEDPVPQGNLPSAGQLMQFMFGGSGRNAAISDSREIGALAKALQSEPAVSVLSKGGSVSDALDASRPPDALLLDLIGRGDKSLAEAVKVASGLPSQERGAYEMIQLAVDKVSGRVDSLIAVIEKLKPRRKGRREEN